MVGRFWRWQLEPEPTPIVHVIKDEVRLDVLDGSTRPVQLKAPETMHSRVASDAQQPLEQPAADDEIPELSLVAHSVRKPGQLAPIINRFSWDFLASRTYFLVGRNGVGKSLLLKSMSGVGRTSVRSRTGAAPVYYAARDKICDESITPYVFARALCGAVTASSSLQRWGIGHCAHRNVRQLSQGERTRLMLCAASILDPRVLLLDEPTLGLDQDGLATLHRHLAERRKRGRLTLVASHELTVFEIEGGELLLLDHNLERTQISHATDRILNATARCEGEELAGGVPEVARALIEAQIKVIARSGSNP